MKISMKMEQKFDDQTRFEKIVELLPEQKIRLFLDELWNGYYSEGFLELLANYKDYSENILAEFQDKELEKRRKTFNEGFRSLLRFLNIHFFSHLGKYTLYPEKQGTQAWDQKLKELHTLVNILKEKYNELIVGGKEFLDKISSAPEKILEIKNKFPHKLPAGTEWKHFIIQFLNKEEVFIKVNRFKETKNYVDMRFADNRFAKPRPNEGWTFLWVLAKYNGELTIRDSEAKDTYKKQKGLVSEALKSYFKMETDPFFPYQETKSYKTRFILLPPPEESPHQTKKQPILQTRIEQNDVDEEIKQFFDEQTPQVYDEQG